MKKPLVSVAMITYGHEEYIVAAISGVLAQQYEGDIELIIANDKSPDETAKIVDQYFADNPAPLNFKIRSICHQENKGMLRNFVWTLQQCRGKYIATCEGDDFWTDPLKVTKQVDFLERHIDYAIVFSNVHVLTERSENNTGGELIAIKENKTFSGAEILGRWIAHTSTYFFRNGTHIQDLDDFFLKHKFLYGDTPLFLYVLERGKAFGMTDVTSTYRRHETGVTTKPEDYESGLRYISHLKEINSAFNKRKYRSVNNHLISVKYYNLFRKGKSSFLDRVKCLYFCIKYDPLLFFKIIRERIR